MATYLTPSATPPPLLPQTQTEASIEEQIIKHRVAEEYRRKEDYIEGRPHLDYPAQYRASSLTAGTLNGEGMITVPPLMFIQKEGKAMVSLMHLGENVCGHPGIVHGGLLATLLDEGLARCCFPALPNKIGVTANLNIDYLAPTKAGNIVILRATTTKVEGRKAWVEGTIEDESGTPLVRGQGLFIEPKYAAVLKRVVDA